jgi:peptide/nickel transport system substrate-binding protein
VRGGTSLITHKHIAGILGAAILLIVTSGCGSTSAASSAQRTAVVALAPQTSPNWFFPIRAIGSGSDVNMQMESLLYKPLLTITSTDGIDYHHSLASHVAVSHNDTVFTITLNPRYKWSDGKPITAQDVLFTWDIIKTTSSHATNLPWFHAGSGVGGIPSKWRSVVAQGNNRIVVTLTQPVNPQWFIRNGLAQISPVPKFVWNKYPGDMTKTLAFIKSVANSPGNPAFKVVDGPYHFDTMQANNYWAFVPNPQYGGHKSTLSKIVFQYESSASSEFTGLKNGTISFGYLPPSLWSARAQLTHDKLNPAYLFGFNYLQPNLSSQAPHGLGIVFQQQYVREALQMGIDQRSIVQTMYHGQAVAENGPIPAQPPTKFYDPALSKPLYPFNPKAGKALLENHGWHLVNGVMTNANGVKLAFTLTYVSGSNTDTSIVQLIQHDWASEGIQITLQSQPFDNIIARANQTDPTQWNMVWWGGGWTYEPDFYPSGGGLFATGAGANFGGYASKKMDSLIQATYAPGTPAEITSRMNAYQAQVATDLPVLWIPWSSTVNVHAANLHGTVKTFNPVSDLYFPNYWTFSK